MISFGYICPASSRVKIRTQNSKIPIFWSASLTAFKWSTISYVNRPQLTRPLRTLSRFSLTHQRKKASIFHVPFPFATPMGFPMSSEATIRFQISSRDNKNSALRHTFCNSLEYESLYPNFKCQT